MVSVKCIKDYNDLKLKRLVKAGEVIEVADARATVLISAKVAEDYEGIPTQPEGKTTTKKPTKKKGA